MLAFSVIVACLFLPGVKATCLSSQQLDMVDNMSATLNVTPSDLRTFFEGFCNITIDAYSKTETDLKLNLTTTTLQASFDSINSSVDARASAYFDNLTSLQYSITQNVTQFQGNISGRFDNFTDVMTRRFDNVMGTENLTQAVSSLASLMNISQKASNIEQLVDDKVTPVEDRMSRLENDLHDNYPTRMTMQDAISNSTFQTQITAAPEQFSINPLWIIGGAFVLVLVGAFAYINRKKIGNRVHDGIPMMPGQGQAIPEQRPMMRLEDMPMTTSQAAGYAPKQRSVKVEYPEEVDVMEPEKPAPDAKVQKKVIGNPRGRQARQ